MDAAGSILTPGDTGEIVIRGANITAGYESNPEANGQAFVHGWFRTGDQGRMDQDGYLYITGRLKEIINRGGEKVSPREVDEALLDHYDVLQAVTFAVPHDSLGEDVAAAVIMKTNTAVTANELRQSLFGRLAEFKIPSTVLIIDEIPKGPTGKVQRIRLADKLAPYFRQAYAVPRDTVEEVLMAIFEEILGNEGFGIHDNFFNLGGDSLSGSQVIAQAHSLFQCELPITILFRFPSVAELAKEISQHISPERLALMTEMLSNIDALSDEEGHRHPPSHTGHWPRD